MGLEELNLGQFNTNTCLVEKADEMLETRVSLISPASLDRNLGHESSTSKPRFPPPRNF